MMPKINVNPDATRKSSSPYWSEFRHWIRKVTKSIAAPDSRTLSLYNLQPASAAAVGERHIRPARAELTALLRRVALTAMPLLFRAA
jgi:hypothetical protein